MKLELASFPVTDVKFGGDTIYRDGLLSINKEEVLSLINQDSRIASVDVEIVHPSEEVRIVTIRDVVEPRVKVSGPGCVFPGIMGPVDTVGEGRTHRLSGMTVVSTAHYLSKMRAGTSAPNSSILDMWGPCVAITPFASTHNVILVMKLVDNVSEIEAGAAIQMAELSLAHHLAKTTVGLPPPELEVFELTPVDPTLPKVIYILCCLSGANPAISLYGLPILDTLPTLVHPNEFFDGAFTADTRRGNSNYPRTWEWQNHPVIKLLYYQHGKSLNFQGVILHRIAANTHMGKEVGARRVAQVASMLGAEAAIVTRVNVSGNRFIDAMLAIQACERKGIKTVFITPEYGGPYGDELPFLFTVPEADSIVSAGSFERRIELPAPKRVIGPRVNHQVLMETNPVQGRKPQPADVPISPDGWDDIASGIDWWGRGRYFCEGY